VTFSSEFLVKLMRDLNKLKFEWKINLICTGDEVRLEAERKDKVTGTLHSIITSYEFRDYNKKKDFQKISKDFIKRCNDHWKKRNIKEDFSLPSFTWVPNFFRHFYNFRKIIGSGGVYIFDIETNWDNDWTEQGRRNKIFKCGVVYSYDDKKYHKFVTAQRMINFIERAKLFVTYNGEGFDFLVLKKYGLKLRKYKNAWRPVGIKSFDIMNEIVRWKKEWNYYRKLPSLDEMMYWNFGIKKSDYDKDDLSDIMRHCIEDVKYTKRLFERDLWIIPLVLIKDFPNTEEELTRIDEIRNWKMF